MRFVLAAALLALAPAAYAQGPSSLTPVPMPYGGVPAAHATNGVVGTSGFYIPSDAAPKLDIQSANTTLATDCTWSVTFGQTFTSSSPIVHASVIVASPTQPIPCIVGTRSATGATGKCFPAQNTVLTLSIVTTGLTLAPFATTCTNGMPVMVVGREPTQ